VVCVVATLAVVLAACGHTRAPVAESPTVTVEVPTPSPTPTPDQSLVISLDRVMEHTRVLAKDIGLRNSGSEGDAKAAQYLVSQIQGVGWTADKREFPLPQGGVSWNVVGTPPGFDALKPHLIVGGHYDSLNGPGANDNATGVAVALEVMRSVATYSAPLPVEFIGFGAEERQPTPTIHHHVGSRWFVDHLTGAEKAAIVSMENVDMVGLGATIYCPHIATGPTEGAERCLRIAHGLGYDARPKVTPDYSDHGTFLKAGVDAVWIWTGEDPCCNHSVRDTFEHVKRSDVARAATLSLAIVRSYTG
jgi:hypothetical protein